VPIVLAGVTSEIMGRVLRWAYPLVSSGELDLGEVNTESLLGRVVQAAGKMGLDSDEAVRVAAEEPEMLGMLVQGRFKIDRSLDAGADATPMIVKACTRAEGELLYQALARGDDYEPNFYEVGSGSRAEGEEMVTAFREVVTQLLNDCEEDPTLADKLSFDAHAAEVCHEVLPLPDEISGDDSFWRYLAFAETWSLAVWRHGREDDEPPAANHFGLGENGGVYPGDFG